MAGRSLNESGILTACRRSLLKSESIINIHYAGTTMDRQRQMLDLERKLDSLYVMVEEIGRQVTLLVAEKQKPSQQETNQLLDLSDSLLPVNSGGKFPSILDYKNSIVEGSEGKPSESSIQQSLAPEMQIQRLTAQLTAAYNQIAALEEQLLETRIRSAVINTPIAKSKGFSVR